MAVLVHVAVPPGAEEEDSSWLRILVDDDILHTSKVRKSFEPFTLSLETKDDEITSRFRQNVTLQVRKASGEAPNESDEVVDAITVPLAKAFTLSGERTEKALEVGLSNQLFDSVFRGALLRISIVDGLPADHASTDIILGEVSYTLNSVEDTALFYASDLDSISEFFVVTKCDQNVTVNTEFKLSSDASSSTVIVEGKSDADGISMRASISVESHFEDQDLGAVDGWTVEDVLPPQRQIESFKDDIEGELRNQIEDVLKNTLIPLYDDADERGNFKELSPSPEVRARWFRRHLALDSTIHDIQLKLTPSVQRLIRERYRSRPETPEAKREMMGDCLAFLTRISDDLLRDGQKEQPKENNDFHVLLSRALDAEANGAWSEAEREHKRRLSVVRNGYPSPDLAAMAWFEYAKFSLRRGVNNEAALHALGQAIEVASSCCMVDALKLQSALLIEQGRCDEAMSSLTEIAHREHNGEEVGIQAKISQNLLTGALMCLLHDARGAGKQANEALVSAARADETRKAAALLQSHPSHDALFALLKLTEYLVDYSLRTVAERAFSIARQTMETAEARCEIQSLPSAPSPKLKSLYFCVEARLRMLTGEMEEAAALAASACSHDDSSLRALTAHGDSLHALGRLADAAEVYESAVTAAFAAKEVPAPLKLRVRHAHCLLQTGQNERAQEAYIVGAREWETSSLWLGAGISLFRLGDADAADRALRRATVRNPMNPLPHGYLSLMHTMSTRKLPASSSAPLSPSQPSKDQDYARAVLDLALRFGLEDPSLLRELGNSNYEHGRYTTAEALLKRAVDSASNSQTKSRARTQVEKRLEDVQRAQQQHRLEAIYSCS